MRRLCTARLKRAMMKLKKRKLIWRKDMEKYLFTDRRRLRLGQSLSALGFVLYLAGSALALPETALAAILTVFTMLAVWTMLSIVGYPEDARERDITFSTVWGHGALTLLLAACTWLTLRGLVRG